MLIHELNSLFMPAAKHTEHSYSLHDEQVEKVDENPKGSENNEAVACALHHPNRALRDLVCNGIDFLGRDLQAVIFVVVRGRGLLERGDKNMHLH